MTTTPQTRYAANTNIAYWVVGDGRIELVYAPAFVSSIELKGVPEL